VLNDAIESARPAIRIAKHHFRVELPTQPLELVGDSTRLSQVFQNLLDNAAKYTPSGGNIDLLVEEAGHRARVRIRDTGIGIPAELQTRIFELFTRVHPSENIKTSGLGIGLSLAKKLVELHGGQLEVRSEGLDKGSEFIVTLPLVATSHVLPDTNAAATSTQSTTKRVLVVDDNRDAAQSLGMLIEVMGSEVRVAFDGAKALEIAKELDPNIVLLDIGMPGMDGYEVARRLRSSARGGEMTIVALTGWGQKEDKQKAFDAGFDKHFTKPIDMNALAELVG
jgi:CheY-like chemotaxis protein